MTEIIENIRKAKKTLYGPEEVIMD